MQKQQAEAQAAQAPPQGQPEQGGATNPADPTGAGNGNIGIGMAPGPEEQGFSGNEPASPSSLLCSTLKMLGTGHS